MRNQSLHWEEVVQLCVGLEFRFNCMITPYIIAGEDCYVCWYIRTCDVAHCDVFRNWERKVTLSSGSGGGGEGPWWGGGARHFDIGPKAGLPFLHGDRPIKLDPPPLSEILHPPLDLPQPSSCRVVETQSLYRSRRHRLHTQNWIIYRLIIYDESFRFIMSRLV